MTVFIILFHFLFPLKECLRHTSVDAQMRDLIIDRTGLYPRSKIRCSLSPADSIKSKQLILCAAELYETDTPSPTCCLSFPVPDMADLYYSSRIE